MSKAVEISDDVVSELMRRVADLEGRVEYYRGMSKCWKAIAKEKKLFSGRDLVRFLQRVNVGEEGECWEWSGAKTPEGYGRLRFGGRQWYSHRLMFHLMLEPLKRDDVVLHTCNNPKCCSPFHLAVGTQEQNVHHMHASGRANMSGLRKGWYMCVGF